MTTRSGKCIDCGRAFEVRSTTGALPQRCDECRLTRKRKLAAERGAAWRAADPERARASYNRYNRKRLADPEHLRWKREDAMVRAYGLTMADFDALLAQQGGVCAICSGPPNGPGRRFHVDHCHDSKKVRGLLCGKCNTAVGLLDDDPIRAENLAAYLRR